MPGEENEAAILLVNKIDEICTRDKIIKHIISKNGCKKCFYCTFLEKLKSELNKQGFLSFNKHIELWKIEYSEEKELMLAPHLLF